MTKLYKMFNNNKNNVYTNQEVLNLFLINFVYMKCNISLKWHLYALFEYLKIYRVGIPYKKIIFLPIPTIFARKLIKLTPRILHKCCFGNVFTEIKKYQKIKKALWIF